MDQFAQNQNKNDDSGMSFDSVALCNLDTWDGYVSNDKNNKDKKYNVSSDATKVD